MGDEDNDEGSDAWSWDRHTAPFFDPVGKEPAHFVFEQVGDDQFRLVEGFSYHDGDRLEVSASTLLSTDLASIPLFMAWFVPVNGRHTPAAVLHDQLVEQSNVAADPRAARRHADRVFVRSLAATGVPILRRNLMYSAVTAATRWASSVAARMAMLAWALIAAVGTVVLVGALTRETPVLALAAVLAPVLCALLWGPTNYRQGLLSGYAVWFVALPALVTMLAYGLYWLTEHGLRRLVSLKRIPLDGDASAAKPPRPAPYR